MINFELDMDTSGMMEAEIDVAVGNIMDAVAEAARDEWIRQAQESSLITAKEEYINGIGEVEAPSATQRTITLEGWLPNAIEEGAGSFDMKPGLLKGKEHVAVPMLYGKPGQTNLPALPPKTFAKATKLKMGERLSTKLGKSKFEGLQKTVVGKGVGPVQDTFIKFRTVSINSSPDSWIHPGLSPLSLHDKVVAYIEANMDNIVASVE